MKKAKVSRLIAEQKRQAYSQGKSDGAAEERRRATRVYPAPGDGLLYLDRPPTERTRMVHIPSGYVMRDPDAYNMPLDFGMRGIGGMVLEFEPVQKNIVFSNGLRVVWFDWKPRGPFPVTEPVVPFT